MSEEGGTTIIIKKVKKSGHGHHAQADGPDDAREEVLVELEIERPGQPNHRQLQQDEPEDYCISTGVQHSVRDFVNAAFKEVGIAVRWEGEGVDELGIDEHTGKVLVQVDPRYFRPTEVDTLLGDSSKAEQRLGWKPEITLDDMVAEMVREDLKIAERDELCKREGYAVFDYNE